MLRVEGEVLIFIIIELFLKWSLIQMDYQCVVYRIAIEFESNDFFYYLNGFGALFLECFAF